MGNIWGKVFSRREARILMMGLDAAGKTTMLYRLKLGEVVTTIPTIGFNVETIEHKKVKITAWDVGGRDKIRPLYRHYFQNTEAVIFVVDSSDRDRMEYARDEIHRTASEDELKNIPILVVANKQDLPYAMEVDELVNELHLNKIKGHNWYIQQTVATTGEGLYEGLDWLVEQIARGYAQQSVEQLTSDTKSNSQKSSAVAKEKSGFGYMSDVLKSTFKWFTASK